MSKIKTIFLDMDGVIANFVDAAIAACDLPISHDDCRKWNFFSDHLTEDQFWGRIEKTSDFWENIAPYSHAEFLVSICEKTVGRENVIFASSPCLHPNSCSGKISWLRRHGFMRNNENRFMLGPKKHFLAASDRLLIDDRPENCRKFCSYGGNSYLWSQPWNDGDLLFHRFTFREFQIFLQDGFVDD